MMHKKRFKAAVVQMNSSDQVADNIARCCELIAQAAEQGADLIVLPESVGGMGDPATILDKVAEDAGSGPIQDALAQAADLTNTWIVGGTIPLRDPKTAKAKAACILFDDTGQQQAIYHKVHLFDVTIPERDDMYKESDTYVAGTEPVIAPTPFGILGLAVCYDLRFPELFRTMNAHLVVLPSAFTIPTGEAHWEVLLRARAIENQVWILGAGQWGTHANGKQTYGHSMIVDPWGRVAGCLEEPQDSVLVVEIDLEEQAQMRQSFPCLSHRVL